MTEIRTAQVVKTSETASPEEEPLPVREPPPQLMTKSAALPSSIAAVEEPVAMEGAFPTRRPSSATDPTIAPTEPTSETAVPRPHQLVHRQEAANPESFSALLAGVCVLTGSATEMRTARTELMSVTAEEELLNAELLPTAAVTPRLLLRARPARLWP